MSKFLSWFGGAPLENADTAGKSLPMGETPVVINQSVYPTIPITGIEWIDNDGLLRDEGVLFGIAEADYSLKVESIKSAFDKAKADATIRKAQLLAAIDNIAKEEDKCLDSINQCSKEIIAIRANPVKGSHNLIPAVFQLIVYAAICYFNYYLVEYWLTPVFPDQLFIYLGLYLFGLSSVFIGRALLYNSNDAVQNLGEGVENKREKWKIVLEEIGVPLVVSLFICTLSFGYYPVEWSIGAFLLFFFLFSFSGKGLINIIHIAYRYLKLQVKHWKAIWRQQQEKRKQQRSMKSLGKQKETLQSDLNPPESKIKELDAIFNYKIKVFESEYNLAREARSDLSLKQIASF